MQNKITTGDVYLVRFHPSAGKELKRYRPAVVVTSKTSELDTRFCLIAPFTSAKSKNQWELVLKNDALKKESTLLCWYLKTTDIRRLEKRLGSLSPDQCKIIQDTIISFFNS